ncbi:hypothetical protein LJB42_003990 [Komagataella kurtzmanii]|nr:hypothetical protein LJB42_003990 [Komagataella kurtzmanii]
MFWLFVLSLISQALAVVEFTSPEGGETFSVSGSTVTIPIEFKDDENFPSIADASNLVISLCTGPNGDISCSEIETTPPADLLSGSTYEYDASVLATFGRSGSYYLQIYSKYSGGYAIVYSERFSLQSMTGTLTPSGSGSPPANDISMSNAQNAEISKSFTVPYTLQTGRTRYAPMQTQPSGTVSATGWTRRYPTSSVSYYSTLVPSPAVYSTITPGWDYSYTSAVNFATPAPYPSQNGGWYAASRRISRPFIQATTALQRRWAY